MALAAATLRRSAVLPQLIQRTAAMMGAAAGCPRPPAALHEGCQRGTGRNWGWTGGEPSHCLQHPNCSRSRRALSQPVHAWPHCKVGTLKQRLLQLDQPLSRQQSGWAL